MVGERPTEKEESEEGRKGRRNFFAGGLAGWSLSMLLYESERERGRIRDWQSMERKRENV
jgi:hypothetical protein